VLVRLFPFFLSLYLSCLPGFLIHLFSEVRCGKTRCARIDGAPEVE
jgi:hypothetical protein